MDDEAGDNRTIALSPRRHAVQRTNEAIALELRRQGHSLIAVGEQMGLTTKAATRLIQRGLDRITADTYFDVQHIRAVESEHLDAMTAKLYAVLTAPEQNVGLMMDAVDRLLKVQERRARLFNLDKAPPPAAAAAGDAKLLRPTFRDMTEAELRQLDAVFTAARQRREAEARAHQGLLGDRGSDDRNSAGPDRGRG